MDKEEQLFSIIHPSRDYEFIKKISDGSASTIFLSRNLKTGDKVVIKRMHRKEQWQDEYKILNYIKDRTSDRILKLIGFYKSVRYVYFITALYDGFDLFEHIDINIPYPEHQAKGILKEMCLCVKECHDIGIAHLDIKCENFMVISISPPRFVLIDFGHSEKVEENKLIQGNSEYGTNGYLCPEGYDLTYSTKSDIFSLGVCIHLVCTGEYPFPVSECNDYEPFDEPTIDAKCPENVRDLVLQCLYKDPKKRPTISQVLSHSFFN